MKKGWRVLWLLSCSFLFLPGAVFAQDTGFSDDIKSLHSVLGQIYDEMLPLCGQLIGVGRAIAGFAALFYIASRIWRHIANAEPIDFYPLFRPFVLGFAVIIFPSVIALVNGIMQPTVTGTEQMVTDSDKAVAQLLAMKEEAIKKTIFWQMYVGDNGSGDRDKWYRYTHPGEDPASEGFFSGIGNDISFAMSKFSYNFRNTIKQWMSEILKVLFEGASLCIDTIRTFSLIVLAILGPLVFGLAVFDGLQHTLVAWLARYLNVFLWLPVANIFGSIMGKIQENMLKIDLQQIADQGDTFFSQADTAYLIFMLIGIVGYFTVPSVANYIIQPGGHNSLLYKVTNMMGSTTTNLAVSRASQVSNAVTSLTGAAGGFLAHRLSGKSNKA